MKLDRSCVNINYSSNKLFNACINGNHTEILYILLKLLI